jgi:hypothetical protein
MKGKGVKESQERIVEPGTLQRIHCRSAGCASKFHTCYLAARTIQPVIDTCHVRTYNVSMNVTLSIDEQTVTRARKKAEALGKSLNQLIRDYLQTLAGGDNAENSIQEFKRLSGRGQSRGWRFNRDEIHERS